MIESLTLFDEAADPYVVLADRCIYYAVCPNRATCPYAGRAARPAAALAPRRPSAADWQSWPSWPSTPPSARSSGLQFGTDTGRALTSSEWPAVAEQIIEATTS